MERKTYLLPHVCQKVGWWMLLVSLLSITMFIAIDSTTGLSNINVALSYLVSILATCLPYLSMGLICLSQEKEEDEYVSHLRMRSLFWVVVFAFAAGIIEQSMNYIFVSFLTIEKRGVLSYMNFIVNPMSLAIVYVLIFKGSILFNTIKSRKDE